MTENLKISLEATCLQEHQKTVDCFAAIDQSINQLSKQIDQSTHYLENSTSEKQEVF